MEAILEPFYLRAFEAEDRLAKLEALLAKKGESGSGDGNREISSITKDLQSRLELAETELKNEKEKALKEIERLKAENLKLQYRISHLIRAVDEVGSKSAA